MAAKFGKSVSTANLGTIATTSTTDGYVIAPANAILVEAVFSSTDALAAHASNYITFSITNLGQAGAGTNAMLAATDANTTKTTTGSAIAANTARSLTLSTTHANLVVAKGDRIRVRSTANGTSANTNTFSLCLLRWEWTM